MISAYSADQELNSTINESIAQKKHFAVRLKSIRLFDEESRYDTFYADFYIDAYTEDKRKKIIVNPHSREETISRFLSKILRHTPDLIGIVLDDYGKADVNQLVKGVQTAYPEFTKDALIKIVEEDPVHRFAFSDNGTKIKATFGHSFYTKLNREEAEPPAVLYRGITGQDPDSIEKDGLHPKSSDVFLYTDIGTVYRRSGRQTQNMIIYRVDSGRMHQDGYIFKKYEDDSMWSTLEVPAAYISRTEKEEE